MKKNRRLLSLLGFVGIIPFAVTGVLTSCSSNKNINITETKPNPELSKILKEKYTPWYNSLSNEPFQKNQLGDFENAYCTSEQQGICLYACNWGHFWNEYLHKQEEPITAPQKLVRIEGVDLRKKPPLVVRGGDYKYVDSALEKATTPQDIRVFHGVEYQEIEFWEQLEPFVAKDKNDNYDFSACIGKKITSYGYISTSFEYSRAYSFCDGKNWTGGPDCLPLKEKTVFVIDIKKNTNGVAYLSDFKFSGEWNWEEQVLIKRNSSYLIKKIEKQKDANVFFLEML